MADKVDILKNIILDSRKELDSIVNSWERHSMVPDATVASDRRLRRWIERTQARLTPYLTKAEMDNYLSIGINKGNPYITRTKYIDYFRELQDALKSMPELIVADLRDEIMAVSGVKERIANDIIKLRAGNKQIKTSDILKIKGVGAKTAEKIQQRFSFDYPPIKL